MRVRVPSFLWTPSPSFDVASFDVAFARATATWATVGIVVLLALSGCGNAPDDAPPDDAPPDAPTSSTPRDASPRLATPGDWTSPRRLSAPEPGIARWPAVTTQADGRVVVAMSLADTATATPTEVVLRERVPPDTTWSPPLPVSRTTTPSRWPLFPTTSSSDTLHVVWSERLTDADGPPKPTHLFYRARTDAVWRASERVAQLPSAIDGIGTLYAEAPPVVHQGRLHVTYGSSDERGLRVYTTRRGLRSSASDDASAPWTPPVDVTRGAQPYLASGPGDRLFVAYVDALVDGVGRRHANSVFARHSDDGGATWSDPILVHASNDDVARSPRLVAHDGRLVALWRKDTNDDDHADCVFVATSSRGVLWDDAETLCPPNDWTIFDAELIASDETLHVVAATRPSFTGSQGRLYHALNASDGWSALHPIPETSQSGLYVDATASPRGRLHVVWSRVDASTSDVLHTTLDASKHPS